MGQALESSMASKESQRKQTGGSAPRDRVGILSSLPAPGNTIKQVALDVSPQDNNKYYLQILKLRLVVSVYQIVPRRNRKRKYDNYLLFFILSILMREAQRAVAVSIHIQEPILTIYVMAILMYCCNSAGLLKTANL